MADLGETSDPTVLVPGSPRELDAAAGRYGDFARLLEQTSSGLAQARVPDWSGASADAFYASAARDAARLAHLADSSRATGRAVTEVAETTRWAQGQAREAIALWQRASAETAGGGADSSGSGDYGPASCRHLGYDSGESSKPSASDSADGHGATESGAAARNRARHVLRRARLQLLGVRRAATTTVTEHTHTTALTALPRVTTPAQTQHPAKPAPHPAATTPAASTPTPTTPAAAAAGDGRFIGPVAPPAPTPHDGEGGAAALTSHPAPDPAVGGPPTRLGRLSAAVPPRGWDGRLPISPTTAPAASAKGEGRDASGHSGLDGSGSEQWVAGLPGTDPRHVRHVVVALPVHGHHDTLWDVAERSVGDGRRWREIATLNQGLLQPDGRSLHDAGFVRPGWVLAVPTNPASALGGSSSGSVLDQISGAGSGPSMGRSVWSSGPGRAVDDGRGNFMPYVLGGVAAAGGIGLVAVGARHRPTHDVPHPGPAATPEHASLHGQHLDPPELAYPPSRGSRLRPDVDPEPDPAPRPARETGSQPPPPPQPRVGDHSSAGTPATWTPLQNPAASPAASAPRSEPEDFDQPRANDAWATARMFGESTPFTAMSTRPAPSAAPSGGSGLAAPSRAGAGQWVVPIGIRGAVTRTLDLTRQRGLGLIGPGSESAARALLALTLDPADTADTIDLADASLSPGPTADFGAVGAEVQVWITAAMAYRLTGRDPGVGRWPDQLRIYPDLPVLLGQLEPELYRRHRLAATAVPIEPVDGRSRSGLSRGLGRVLLLVEPTQAEAPRLRAVLAHGGGLGVGAVLLGAWPSGTTCQLAIDATVTDATSGAGTDAHELVTTRLWSLTRGELRERLRLDLEPEPSPLNQPHPRVAWGEAAEDGPDLDEPTVAAMPVREPHYRDQGNENTPSYDRHNFSHDQLDRDADVEPETFDETFDEADGEVDEVERGVRYIRDEPDRGESALSDELDSRDEPADSEEHEIEGRSVVPESARLVVHCFGAFGLFARQDPAAPLVEITEIVPAKQRLLLRCLASRPDGVGADELLEAGWPDSPLAAARRRLHTTLTQLRRTLAGHTGASTGTFAVLVGQRYHLTRPTTAPTAARPGVETTTDARGAGGGAEVVWVDWRAFQSALEAARAATGEARVPAWTRAARLYRGPLWPDESDIYWVEPLRYTADVDALGVLGQLATYAEQHGQHDHAVAWLSTGLDHHPTDEPTVEALIRLHRRAGRPELAHRAYTALAARLAAAGLPGPDAATTAALQDTAAAHP